ncbi:acetyltransferase [Hymenobacter negativus]|uniref:Acetyltransferase n=1 Tax=Hymenobacter negativus TaxID=2795026 RepID=A0ABS3QE65_9BACT|nr:acetyltransferase [Hymenobacter negativus]MBO2009511.1 acetyltransferase [Hymenobacter negativus]
MKKLAIIGSGDLGQLIAYHAAADKHYQVVGFFDDFRVPSHLAGDYPVLGGVEAIASQFQAGQFDELMIGIGYKHLAVRRTLFQRFAGQVPLGRVVHSSASVDASCRLGTGVFVLPGCVLDRNVVLADNVLLNTACVIAHDSQVGAHTFLSPRVAVAGFVQIGEGCNIGINTTLIDNITLADGIQTGGGTVVIKSLAQPGLYVGNPARFIR